MNLTEKQIRFCKEYIIDANKTQAAIKAGYSSKTAESQGSRLLTNVNVVNFIQELKKDVEKANKITIQKVLNELDKMAFSNITDYIEVKEDTITLTDWTKLSKEQTAAIESVHQTKDGYRIKLYNKPHALEMIGKHLGMFAEIDKEDLPEPPECENMTDEQLDNYIKNGNGK